MEKVRVRFAPSPTGPLHIGGVRTALFNYLFAKKHGGDFLLRIEDTDQVRFVEGAEKYIVEALEWCGLKIDEGVTKGGDYGPYKQSERKDLYKQYAMNLITEGKAYFAFDTPEEIDAMREKLKAEGSSNQQYGIHSRMGMKNSLSLSGEEVQKRISAGDNYVIRIKMPENEIIIVNDLIRGEVKFDTNILDDKVLFKSDGMPTYHLANIVDDHLMKITHVIRGEEWLPSLPLHKLLYQYFGWEDSMPQFAHLPLLLKPNGKGKLSKRDGDKGGFPVFPLQWTDPKSGDISSGYRESGYFNDAFINMMAFLGWNPGTEQEIFTMQELVQAFDIEKVGKAGAKFDPEKAKWFNHQYLQTKSNEELTELYQTTLKEKNLKFDNEFVQKVVSLIKERANFVSDFWEQSSFFFEAPVEYDAKMVKKRWKEDTSDLMKKLSCVLKNVEPFTSENTEKVVKEWLEASNLGMGQVMTAFRLAVVGAGKGPHMFDIIELIGKEETLKRIERAIIILDMEKYIDISHTVLNEFETPLKYKKEIIKQFFENEFNLSKDKLIYTRLSLIDNFYSTQMNTRNFGIEQLSDKLTQFEDNEIKNLIKDENFERLHELFDGKYGYSKNLNYKKAISLISKYLYFLTDYNFPIKDKFVNANSSILLDLLKIKIKYPNRVIKTDLIKNFYRLNTLKTYLNIESFEKLDNFLWLWGKIKEDSYSSILTDDEYQEYLKTGELNQNSKKIELLIEFKKFVEILNE